MIDIEFYSEYDRGVIECLIGASVIGFYESGGQNLNTVGIVTGKHNQSYN